MTALEIINGSLRLIGAIASGETAQAGEIADGLAVLNDIIESWANDGLMIYKRTRESFPLVAAQQTYTMGDSANFDTDRPQRILAAGVVVSSIEIPIEIINEQQWAAISYKTQTASFPTKLFSNNDSDIVSLSVWPIPTAVNNLILYSQAPFGSYGTSADEILFPPGWSRALKYNLAGEFGIEFGKPLDPIIAAIAAESKADIKRQNIQPIYMASDALGLSESGGKRFNIYSGE